MALRIVTGGIAQETNTFQWEPTTLADFQQGSSYIDRGEQILALEGTGTIYGGIVAEAKRLGVELIPTTYGRAVPGGRVTREAFEALRLLAAMAQGETRPTMAHSRLPLIAPNQSMVTTWQSPLKIAIDRARAPVCGVSMWGYSL